MKSLDANIALRLMLQDVPNQLDKIFGLIEDSKVGSLAIADVVFFECVWILSGKTYNFSRRLIGDLLLQVADIPEVNCNVIMLQKAVPLYVKYSQISFVDACLAVYAELNGATPLLTFDRKLAKAMPASVTVL